MTDPTLKALDAFTSEVLAVLKQAEEYLRHPDVQAIPFTLSASVPLRNVRKLIAELEEVTS